MVPVTTGKHWPYTTIMFLSFRTERSGQTVQTQIRLQSDQGLHCLQYPLHLLDALLCSTFKMITTNVRVSEILGFLQYDDPKYSDKTHIKLLLKLLFKEQSDQGLHCLP